MAQTYPRPAVRALKVYAFDPQASVTLATAMDNDFVVELPWEERWESPLEKGPVNDYVEVIDIDPAAGLFYEPVDLNDNVLLAQGSLAPSEGRPQFHQQMVFAVVMRTIRAFERALGRTVLWARDDDVSNSDTGLTPVERNFTKRLRIYPHALREANAYYSPAKRALLFGYFRADAVASDIQANWVFTCLSQDIIAHETTHAILHGMRQRSIEPSNVDAMAFHEAFADIIALLQHFSMKGVVRHLLGASRGSLREPGLLTGLGDQFGRATGRRGALRYALEELTRRAEEAGADGQSLVSAAATLDSVVDAHARGGFLVAAVFDAFVTIYERRTADLMRLGRPVSADDGLHPDLVARLADEAAKAADQVMRMCVRALDYAPPVDLRFGEYLRAIITADTDLVPNDPLLYRIAFIEAFKRWGITVPGCISMAPDSLLWDPPQLSQYPEIVRLAQELSGAPLQDPGDALNLRFTDLLSRLQFGVSFATQTDRPERHTVGPAYLQSDFMGEATTDLGPQAASRNLRDLSMEIVLHNQKAIHAWFDGNMPDDEDWERLLGMRLLPDERSQRGFVNASPLRSLSVKGKSSEPSPADEPAFEVHSARISRRTGPDGHELHLLVVQMTQRRRAYFDPREQDQADAGDIGEIGAKRWENPDFWFRGGATLHVDLRDGRLLRIIRKRIDNADRLKGERAFRTGETTGTPPSFGDGTEPFAFLHRSA